MSDERWSTRRSEDGDGWFRQGVQARRSDTMVDPALIVAPHRAASSKTTQLSLPCPAPVPSSQPRTKDPSFLATHLRPYLGTAINKVENDACAPTGRESKRIHG